MPTFAHAKLAVWTDGRWTRNPEGEIVGFNQDSRTLAPGQVFVALRTEKRDGHDFLAPGHQLVQTFFRERRLADQNNAQRRARFPIGVVQPMTL